MENPAEVRMRELRERFEGWQKDPECQARWAKRTARMASKENKSEDKVNLNIKTRDWLRKKGYWAYRADYYDHLQKRQHDFFGIFDFVALPKLGGQTVGVQLTTEAHMSDRRKKILDSKVYPYLAICGWKVLLVGWFKNSSGHWEAKEEWL